MPPGRPATRRPSGTAAADGSRDRVLAAARREFAAYGFAGASVDRIATTASLNKAMIYYHFRSKAALYQEILREMFGAVGTRVRGVAASGAGPQEKVSQFVRAIAVEAQARPHFPPIWFREIAEGGTHLDDATLREIASVVQGLAGFIAEGVRAGVFRPLEPIIVHAGIVGPLLLYFASAGLRQRMKRAGLSGAARYSRDEVIAHIERVTLGVLEGRIECPEITVATRPRKADYAARPARSRAAAHTRGRRTRRTGPSGGQRR